LGVHAAASWSSLRMSHNIALPSELLLNIDFQVPEHDVELWIVATSGVRRVAAFSLQRLHTIQQ
jgi:hypothetical protein